MREKWQARVVSNGVMQGGGEVASERLCRNRKLKRRLADQ